MFLGFEWFPKRWGKRKVSEKFLQAKFADEGKGILIITYAIDLYVISIPLKVKKYNSL
ncbi:hypothetical protein PDR34_14090 [Bacillus cereus]|uniref:hypothetical protein n=1 Tax=Bacillus TaxID=1386 RepID=UPI001BB41E7B|nr:MULTISPECIES: hypothetical protein [Bacillus]MDA1523790.1 hypothetical protein [Bacillus cereus]MDA2730918.1 hypothetical protein [Bacillus cereus]QUW26181.1 hypothetical protein J8Y16_24495 [Bacillus cereus]WNV19396.1 hypothetical protein RS401_25160 [Bacillus sp. SI2]